MKTGYWTAWRIQALGFELKSSHKLWCHFTGHDCEVHINLDIDQVDGNHFNFHGKHYGHISLILETEEELMTFIEQWVYRKKNNKWDNPFIKIRGDRLHEAEERLRNLDEDIFPKNLFTNLEEE